jgi:phenylpropionate dioxygenase-like ring-hydroxylating dioxygenase large terminal subunit
MPMSGFVRNGWYMACWTHEVPDGGFLARRLLDKPWVIWRKADGTPVMMADRCAHRFVPLSRGARDGDMMRCAYHGLAFDGSGACAHNPFTGQPLDLARVEVLPIVERHTGLWFWPGDADKADPSLIPDFSFLESDRPLHRGHIRMDASYELVTDNLMDLSHAEFIHRDSFGVNGSLLTCGEHEVVQEESGAIWNNWTMPDSDPPAWAVPMLPEGAKTDQWLHMRWNAPSNLALFIGLARSDTDRKDMVVPPMADPHILVPETVDSTHYFYTHEPTPEAFALLEKAFLEEDHPMLHAQQQAMGEADFWDLKPVILPSDAGAIRVRRRMMQLRRAEQADAA